MRSHRLALVVLALAGLVGACNGVGSESVTPASSAPSASATASPSPSPSPSLVEQLSPSPSSDGPTYTEADNGRTVTVTKGQIVRVALGSTYWQFDPSSDPTVIKEMAAPVYVRGKCGVGEGCGTVTQTFEALSSGTAVISARRTSCGEALACQPDQKSFALTVAVH